jgi:hypothetical protein
MAQAVVERIQNRLKRRATRDSMATSSALQMIGPAGSFHFRK